MKYVIRKRCAQKITTFYRNVSKKYKHTYSLELMVKNVNDAYITQGRFFCYLNNANKRTVPVLLRIFQLFFDNNVYTYTLNRRNSFVINDLQI